jgi:hypothetical protein
MSLGVPIISSFNDKGVRAAKGAFKDLQTSGDKLSKSLKLGMAAGAAGIAGAAYAAFDFAKAAMEDQAAAAQLANALKNTTGATDAQVKATEDWITKTSLATGVADDELRPALAAISRSTHDVTKAQKLLGTAQNIAAGTGKPLAAVSQAVAKAYAGQTGALKKLSPETAKLIKAGASTDEVFASLDKTFKGAADTMANTTAGKMKRLGVATNELKEGIGSALLPAFEGLADFALNKLGPAFTKFQDSIDKNGLMKTLSETFKKGWDWLTSKGLPMLLDKLQEFGKAIVEWVGPRIGPFLQALGELITKGANWLLDTGLPTLVDKMKQLGQALVDWIKPNIVPMLTKLGELIAAIAVWALTVALPKLISLAAEWSLALVGWVLDLAPELIKGLGSAIWELVKALPKLGKKLLDGFVDLSSKIGKAIANGAIAGLNMLIDAFNDVLEFNVPLGFGKHLTVNPPDIPHIPALAQGGIVTGPQLALIGEAGPEAVIPLSKMGAMGGNTFVIQTGVGDPVAIGREIEKVMQRYSRRTGVAA